MANYRNLSDADLWSQLALAQMVQKRFPPTSREWKEQSRKIHALARENKRRYGPKRKKNARRRPKRNTRVKVTASQRAATAKFHQRMAAAFAAAGQSENAAHARRAAKLVRRKRRNPSRYKGRGEYIVTAQKKGGKLLRLVEGNKFAESGRPVLFPTERAAAATARWLRRMFPVLKAYNPRAAPK